MCGRFSRDTTWEQVHAFSRGLDLIVPPEDPEPSYNIAPTQSSWVPASGYYEWRVEDGVKQPYWIHDSAGPVLMFAGLWENWKTPEGDWLQSFAIITRAAEGPMLQLHDRTPLMLDGGLKLRSVCYPLPLRTEGPTCKLPAPSEPLR